MHTLDCGVLQETGAICSMVFKSKLLTKLIDLNFEEEQEADCDAVVTNQLQ